MQLLAFGIGTQEIILILALALLLFGAAKLPQLGSAIGQGIRNFKRGMREVKAEEEDAKKLEAEKIEAENAEKSAEKSDQKSAEKSDDAAEKSDDKKA